MNAIHARGLRSRHIPHGAMRSSLQGFVTCKHCQRMKGYTTMDVNDVRRMVRIVRAIKAGKWTDQPPAWAGVIPPDEVNAGYSKCFINADDYSKACLVAEAFILLAHSSGLAFDETKFLHDAGLTA